MDLKPPRNTNYAATVVALKDFVQLEGCDRIQAALIFGNHVIVGKDAKAGDVGLFFPVETALSDEFLSNNNLYRKPEWGNVDTQAKGFFEQHGRVKCVRFRGHKSEGFYIPMSGLDYLNGDGSIDALDVEDTFDELDGYAICHKYVPKRNPGKLSAPQQRQLKLIDQIVPNQFRFHTDTEQLRRNLHKIRPDDIVSISTKFHGTSVVISKVMTVRPVRWREKLAGLLGVHVSTTEYGLVYSSRKVVKSVNGVEKTSNHFYTTDIWGIVAKEVADRVPVGYTIYGEIVGFTQEGAPIQPGYHYGCPKGGHRLLVYRITTTNVDGIPLELSWPQMKEFCQKYGFELVEELYYGRAGDLLEGYTSNDDTTWNDHFLEALESRWVHDQMCPHNNNEVPAEGVVVRIDRLTEADAYKLKAFAFLSWETKQLDKGELDIETAESEYAA